VNVIRRLRVFLVVSPQVFRVGSSVGHRWAFVRDVIGGRIGTPKANTCELISTTVLVEFISINHLSKIPLAPTPLVTVQIIKCAFPVPVIMLPTAIIPDIAILPVRYPGAVPGIQHPLSLVFLVHIPIVPDPDSTAQPRICLPNVTRAVFVSYNFFIRPKLEIFLCIT
jgi:hypothetical protein